MPQGRRSGADISAEVRNHLGRIHSTDKTPYGLFSNFSTKIKSMILKTAPVRSGSGCSCYFGAERFHVFSVVQ